MKYIADEGNLDEAPAADSDQGMITMADPSSRGGSAKKRSRQALALQKSELSLRRELVLRLIELIKSV